MHQFSLSFYLGVLETVLLTTPAGLKTTVTLAMPSATEYKTRLSILSARLFATVFERVSRSLLQGITLKRVVWYFEEDGVVH